MSWPDICVLETASCPNAWPVLLYSQNTCGCQIVCIKDRKGCPIDLTNRKVCLVVADVPGSTNFIVGGEGEVLVPEDGTARFCFEAEDLELGGMFLGEIQVIEQEEICEEGSSEECSSEEPEESSSGQPAPTPFAGKIIFRARAYVEVEANLTDFRKTFFPICVAELRLAIRDKCALDNFLLDNVQFTDTEIAWALRRPVEWFNETPPDLRKCLSVANFPWRYNHLNGAVGELLFMVAGMNEERNRLTYSSAGLTVGDRDHAKAYLELGTQLKADYQKWGLGKKKALNMESAFQRTEIRSFGNAFQAFSGHNFHVLGSQL